MKINLLEENAVLSIFIYFDKTQTIFIHSN